MTLYTCVFNNSSELENIHSAYVIKIFLNLISKKTQGKAHNSSLLTVLRSTKVAILLTDGFLQVIARDTDAVRQGAHTRGWFTIRLADEVRTRPC